jgi:hypothetical protein
VLSGLPLPYHLVSALQALLLLLLLATIANGCQAHALATSWRAYGAYQCKGLPEHTRLVNNAAVSHTLTASLAGCCTVSCSGITACFEASISRDTTSTLACLSMCHATGTAAQLKHPAHKTALAPLQRTAGMLPCTLPLHMNKECTVQTPSITQPAL